MSWATRRKEPYTEAGVRRLKCIRCDATAHAQWQICADAGNYRPICRLCDAELNRMVLEWMGHPEAARLSDAYAAERTT